MPNHMLAQARSMTPVAATGGEPGEVLEKWSSLIGIVTAIVGNVLIALALNVQRYAHTRLHKERAQIRQRARAALKRAQSGSNVGAYGTMSNGANGHGNARSTDTVTNNSNQQQNVNDSDPLSASFQSNATTDIETPDSEKVASTYLKSPYWWLGQILITLGEMGNFLAYGFAPASIVSPLGVVALISNCIIAPVMFHERFRVRDFWGVVIAVAGVVTVVFSASQEETKLEPHDVWDAITSLEFEIYLGVTILLIIILMWASSRYGRRTILIDLGLVGLFGGYTALATKGVSSLLSATLWRAFTTPVTYALIVILLSTAIMQIRYVNKALQRFDSTQVIPIQFVLFTLCVILGSAILYRDFEKTTPQQAAAFVGGCLLTFFGVFLITSGRQQKGVDDDDDDDLLSEIDGVEETIGLRGQEEPVATSARGDQDTDTPKTQSRRSSRLSRVSFADTVTPTSVKEEYGPPAQQRISESAPNSLGTESFLVDNPWRESCAAPSNSPPRGLRTFSADSAVGTSAILTTPGGSTATTPMRDPALAPTYLTNRPVTPRQGSVLSRTASHRRSKTFISPSPLSSTVTAVVKDAFLRENDGSNANTSSMRRIRSSIRASLFFNDEDWNSGQNAASYSIVPSSDNHLPRSFENQDDNLDDEGQARTRSRSVSDAIGDFFRSKKKDKDDDTGDDVETGRSPTDTSDNVH